MVETVLGMTDLQIKLFTAIGQILVAAAVGIIAWRQWRTARNKLKADLFDRRFTLFRNLEDALDVAMTVSKRQEGLEELEYYAREVKWVFGKSLEKKLREQVIKPIKELVDLVSKATEQRRLENIAKAARAPFNDTQLRKLRERIATIRKTIESSPGKLRTLFDEQLTLKH
ncbi:hypothetical protein [Stenotrophomonas maltophilia]|jgi:hypothetical protein|uniref:Transmembrane protein n=1 Tax=Stenotrophomonas maltophilia TaxID=40324 RepID=A0A2J0U9C7_STEMA|nr:hypothetical protein [Stenotrophomonas maltophilia]PJL25930.1 hypothetical protein B9Y64_15510 [Stenotrophomonas maltophilia]HEL5401728.1 hypothetical protein [Stenotrophomonas maltophilia]